MVVLTSTTIVFCLYFLVEIKAKFTKDDPMNLGCPELKDIDSVTIKPLFASEVEISCNDGFVLSTQTQVECVEGEWRRRTNQTCKPLECPPPPKIKSGHVHVDKNMTESFSYPNGALAVYGCNLFDVTLKLTPPENKYKVCERGKWVGGDAKCIKAIDSCPPPEVINLGYYVGEETGESFAYQPFPIGQRVHYSCRQGWVLEGTSVQQCLEDGTWSPRIPPTCVYPSPKNAAYCDPFPTVPNSIWNVGGDDFNRVLLDGNQAFPHNTVVKYNCQDGFINQNAMCQTATMTCNNGTWTGLLPMCEPIHECIPPPKILFATYLSTDFVMDGSYRKFPVNSNITYQCALGYTLNGINNVLTCMNNGCWSPSTIPICIRDYSVSVIQVDNFNSIMISIATGIGVLGILLLICVIVIYRRRKSISRNLTIPTPIPRAQLGLGDHATLLHHPDRLALIAFADGLREGCQSSLPSYDEATREQRSSGSMSARLHRPQWPNLAAGRRPRNSTNPDVAQQVTRHGSFVSHTPSTRSGGDSMGSTDTMAVSEGSTVVTLDTVSSYSSQPASCRAHCGSLASFDACSVVNPDDIPLLEESELEEIQNDDMSPNIVDCNSLNSDSISFKNNTADLA